MSNDPQGNKMPRPHIKPWITFEGKFLLLFLFAFMIAILFNVYNVNKYLNNYINLILFRLGHILAFSVFRIYKFYLSLDYMIVNYFANIN